MVGNHVRLEYRRSNNDIRKARDLRITATATRASVMQLDRGRVSWASHSKSLMVTRWALRLGEVYFDGGIMAEPQSTNTEGRA